jgi:LmbE family N-acetylglucosaminyl deacetylase
MLGPLEHHSLVPVEPAAASQRLGWTGLEAARFSGLADADVERPALTHHSVILFTRPPDVVLDVTAVQPAWEAAMRCHKSQMKTRAYVDLVNARARLLGAAIGTEYAIALWANDPLRVRSLADLPLSSRHF